MSSIFSSIPILSAFILNTSTGAVSDRLWQFTFMTFTSLSLMKKFQTKLPIHLLLILALLIFMGDINVLVRYPLSNLFYPLLPYEFIDPGLLVF